MYFLFFLFFINFPMTSGEIRTWIYGLLWSQKINKKNKYPTTCSHRTKIFKPIRLSSQTVSLFQNIIFETIHKIGKALRGNQLFKLNIKINHDHILNNFIRFKFLNTCVWMFKFRTYFSKFKIHQSYLNPASSYRRRL